jgi:hypothetical protein
VKMRAKALAIEFDSSSQSFYFNLQQRIGLIRFQ